jgi:hypothetical protein
MFTKGGVGYNVEARIDRFVDFWKKVEEWGVKLRIKKKRNIILG